MADVSGVITTYHRDSGIVEKAILSMLEQTVVLKEIVVVDDNEDSSRFCPEIETVCGKYSNVEYVKQNGNKGACAARNLGIAHTSGEYIAFLDDDDAWLPNKTELQLRVFEGDPDVGLVYCCGIQRNQETGEEKDYYNAETFKEYVTFNDLLVFDYVGSTSQPLIRRSCFEKVGGFWEEQPARQDYEMWMRISQEYKIVGIPEKLFIHTIHDGEQISRSSKRAYTGYRNIYKKYKKYYKKSMRAKYCICSLIYKNITEFNVFNIWITINVLFFKVLAVFGLLKRWDKN